MARRLFMFIIGSTVLQAYRDHCEGIDVESGCNRQAIALPSMRKYEMLLRVSLLLLHAKVAMYLWR